MQGRDRIGRQRADRGPGQLIGQDEEGGVIVLALLAQQCDAESGLIDLARHDLTED